MKLLNKPVQFFSDVNQEMSKVSWPTYEELKESTIVVIIISLIFAMIIFAADTILSRIMELIY